MKEFQGAEATVKIEDKVEKDRKKKEYRHSEIDDRIRTERNKQETRILEKARKNGINVPEIVEIGDKSFEMEKIEGKALKKLIDGEPQLAEMLAEQVARLHSADMIHGDLTTSNAIVSGEEVYLIDFGLSFHSERVEDKAVDIHLLKQVLNASHKKSEDIWSIFKKTYQREGNAKVVEKVPDIEERARYK